MTTIVAGAGPNSGVSQTLTAPRVTPPPARPFQQMMNASSTAIVNSVEALVTRLPGGPILAAAVRPAGAGAYPAVARAEGPTGTAAAVSGPGSLLPGSSATGGGLEQVLATNADQNLYYLQIQEQMSQENRTYTALSNVLKARHDTVKNAIGNIR